MFPLAARHSMNKVLFMPSSQWIKPKSEILVKKTTHTHTHTHKTRIRQCYRIKIERSAELRISQEFILSFQKFTDLDVEMIVHKDIGSLQVKME